MSAEFNESEFFECMNCAPGAERDKLFELLLASAYEALKANTRQFSAEMNGIAVKGNR